MLPDTAELVRVFEPESSRLLAVGHETCHEPDSLSFECDSGGGALLAYYFGKGKRSVVMQCGPNEGVTAHLATRWARGHREWTLDW